MHENTFFKKIGTERLKLLAVLLFFLFSGIWYSHSFATGALEMGTPASAEKITEKREINAENDAGRLNINTATAKELTRLSGIGEKKADAFGERFMAAIEEFESEHARNGA